MELFKPGLEPQTGSSKADPLWGTVLAVQANFYFVKIDAAVAGIASLSMAKNKNQLLCTRRARLKKMGQRVIVGDRVRIEEPDWEGGRGAIAEVEVRKTFLDRPPVANANQILLVFALADPDPEPYQLSRFLVKAESTGMAVCVCFNKCDLVAPTVQQSWRDRLQNWGYQPILSSAQQRTVLADLQAPLQDTITVVSGPSGVGKSSLINQLAPQLDLRTRQVSGKLGRGVIQLATLNSSSYPQAASLQIRPDLTSQILAAAHNS